MSGMSRLRQGLLHGGQAPWAAAVGMQAPMKSWGLAWLSSSSEHPHLPRTRSVEQAPVEDESGMHRSVDAPADPYDKRHRDTTGLSEDEVKRESEAAVARAGARATEALSGRADMLRENPSFHMPAEQRGGQKEEAKEWVNNLVGDGVKETMKQGSHKAKEALNKMFRPGGRTVGSGHTSSPASNEDTDKESRDAAMHGQLPGARRRASGDDITNGTGSST